LPGGSGKNFGKTSDANMVGCNSTANVSRYPKKAGNAIPVSRLCRSISNVKTQNIRVYIHVKKLRFLMHHLLKHPHQIHPQRSQ
jgi:hypothetical protein